MIKSNLNTNFLKLIGIITMTIDHFGKMLYPSVAMYQIIGRLAFPLFAYSLAVGSVFTKNPIKYILRLLIPAIVFQLVYKYFIPYGNLNIMFTLAIGLLCILCIQKKYYILLPIILIITYFIKVDYGVNGVCVIITFYLFRDKPLVSALLTALQLFFMFGWRISDSSVIWNFNLQCYSILALPLIYIHTNVNIKINKYFFYAYYPLHFFILYVIQILMMKF